jgi:hypothetical protein
MKKSVLLMAGVCLLSGMTAFADPVTSVNAVGVTKVDLPVGFSLLACPFNAVGGQGLSLDEMFGTSLPDLSAVFVYVNGTGYVSYYYYAGDGWRDDGANPVGSSKVLRGEGFWVYTPEVVSNLALSGEVPASAVGTNRIDLVQGFQLVSFAFPQDVAVGDSGLNPRDLDVVFKYINGAYVSFYYYDGDGWRDDGANPVDLTFRPNEGFWYMSEAAATNTWEQKKTYTWP